jgi:histidyl-tRNA synthetase
MDIWGVETVHAEAELLSSIVTFMCRVGITSEDVGIKINNRKILTSLMAKFGIPEEKWMATFVLIDKLEKVPLESLSDDLSSIGLSKDDIVRLLDSLQIKTLVELKSLLGEDDIGYKEISLLFELAESYNISDWITFDASVVRGLAYYTGIVFEGFDRSGELRAIFGGGRYDTLLEMLGGSSTPAVGFGFGDAVIVELLKMRKLLPDFSKTNQQILVYGKTETCRNSAIKLATILREQMYSVDLVLEEKKPKWAFQRANKFGTANVILVGENDDNEEYISVKQMDTGEQTIIPVENDDLSSIISQIIMSLKI